MNAAPPVIRGLSDSDKTTTDDDCERLLTDKDLLDYLKQNFVGFEVRR